MTATPLFDSTLTCVLHTGDLYGSGRSCLAHIDCMRVFFRDVHLVTMQRGPIEAACAQRNIPCTVLPLEHRGLRSRGLSYRWGADLAAVLHSRWRVMRSARRFFQQHIGLVHIHSSTALYPMLAAKCSDLPVVTHVRETRRSRAQDAIRERLVQWASDEVVTVSDGIRKGYGSSFQSRATTIYNYCIAGPEPRRLIRADPPRIGFVASIHHEKGILEFLRVCARLTRAHVAFVAPVFGAVLHPKIKETCDNFIREHELGEHVLFKGLVSDVDAIYNEIDIVVHPSHFDALPRTIMEALSRGLPVVASNVGGIPEMIQHGESGFLAHHADTETMARHVTSLLQDRTLYATMSEAAYARAQLFFSRDTYVKKMQSVYRRTLDLHD